MKAKIKPHAYLWYQRHYFMGEADYKRHHEEIDWLKAHEGEWIEIDTTTTLHDSSYQTAIIPDLGRPICICDMMIAEMEGDFRTKLTNHYRTCYFINDIRGCVVVTPEQIKDLKDVPFISSFFDDLVDLYFHKDRYISAYRDLDYYRINYNHHRIDFKYDFLNKVYWVADGRGYTLHNHLGKWIKSEQIRRKITQLFDTLDTQLQISENIRRHE